jgi:hypothetical protein
MGLTLINICKMKRRLYCGNTRGKKIYFLRIYLIAISLYSWIILVLVFLSYWYIS